MKSLLLLIALIPTLANCNNQHQDSESNNFSAHVKTVQPTDSLHNIYASGAIKILEDGRILNGSAQIIAFNSSESYELISITSDTTISANKRMAIDYEISESVYKGDIRYKNLIIWQSSSTDKKKVFEFSAKVRTSASTITQIDKRREAWIELCNKNNAKNLIDEMYSENTMYFNHKPIVKGRASLANVYQYMNNESYELHLHPEFVDQVNDNFIFEIGQCSGGYGGKYILIWKKESDGEWRIFIDSNI